jgi:hypothetical protein
VQSVILEWSLSVTAKKESPRWIRLKLPADLTIVDEKIMPSDYTADLARIFELEEDLNGFA